MMRMTSHVALFFNRMEAPSNWYIRPFIVNKIAFNCVEQCMMYSKAMLFKDTKTADLILAKDDPAEQKKLGRLARAFDEGIWRQNGPRFVFIACREKFAQNPELLAFLLSTRGLIAEASPYDRIWGIGLRETDPAALDPAKWKGLNWLGQILTILRDGFRLRLWRTQ